MIQELVDAVHALRLAKSGWFANPMQVALTFAASSPVWQIERFPGPYRQLQVGSRDTPLPPYALSIADLATTSQAGRVYAMGSLIWRYRETSANAAVDIALGEFGRAHGVALADDDRAAMLFTALDAMLSGMSARRIGRMRLRRFGFRRRLATALAAVGVEDAETDAAWVDWEGGGRGWRNALAHGDRSGSSPRRRNDLLRLFELLRALLPGFVSFALRWRNETAILAPELGLPESAGLTAAFNRALEVGRGDLVAPSFLAGGEGLT